MDSCPPTPLSLTSSESIDQTLLGGSLTTAGRQVSLIVLEGKR